MGVRGVFETNKIAQLVLDYSSCPNRSFSSIQDVFDSIMHGYESSFSSLSQFVDYFRYKERLVIARGRALEIKDHKPIDFKELSAFLRVINKKLKVHATPTQSIILDSVLSVDPIDISELFRIMIATSNLEFRCMPGQKISYVYKRGEDYQVTINRKLPNGYNCTLVGKYQRPRPVQKVVTISSCDFTISIKDEFHFDAIRALRDRLSAGPLVVPPGKKVIISGPFIEQCLHYYPNENANILFIFQQIMVTRGKLACVDPIAETTLANNQLCLSNPEGFTLRPGTQENTLIDLTFLGEQLISDQRFETEFDHKKIVILNLTEEEIQACYEGTVEERQNAGASIFFRRNPLGFTFKLSGQQFKIAKGVFYGVPTLEINFSSKLKLELLPASGTELIANLIIHSKGNLFEELQEQDARAYTFILFKAISYFACGDFRHIAKKTQLPNHFQPHTQAAIQKLLDDPQFEQKVKDAAANNYLVTELRKIFNSTLDEFEHINVQTLPKPLAELVSPIFTLTYAELYGSPLMRHIPDALKLVSRLKPLK